MTLSQFSTKYLGKQVEYHSYDPNAKYQCVDLVNQYIVEVLRLDPVIGTHAKDFPSKINTSQFLVIKNTPEFVPVTGDIAVWNGRAGGGYGHIAVVRDNKATLNTFNSLDQNWSKPLFVTLETHNYTNVSYFLRAKVSTSGGTTTPETTYEGIDLTNIESVKVAIKTWAGVRDGKYIKKDDHERIVNELKESVKQEIQTKEREHQTYLETLIKTLNPAQPKGVIELSDETWIKQLIEGVLTDLDTANKAFKDLKASATQEEKKEALELSELKKALQKIKSVDVEAIMSRIDHIDQRFTVIEESKKSRDQVFNKVTSRASEWFSSLWGRK